MRRIVMRLGLVAGLVAIFLVAAGSAAAPKPSWGDEGRKNEVSQDAYRFAPERVLSPNRIRQPPGPSDRYRAQASGPQDRHGHEPPFRRDSARGVAGDRGYRFPGDCDRSPIDRYYEEARDPQGRHRQEPRSRRHSEPGGFGDRDRSPIDRYYEEARDPQGSHRQESRHRRYSAPGDRHHRFFGDRDRSPIDRYYSDRYRRGHCPPGLIRTGNGCMPPGQAKKWVLHRPLPREVIFYDLPQDVLVHLGPPPNGHRFVRVARDILLISVGTGMVVDAIEDLGRLD